MKKSTAQMALEALKEYANPANWDEDFHGVKRKWLEPNSDTRNAYCGYELAKKAIAALDAEIAQPVEPVWFACDTEGADFDVTFVTTREEAAELVDCTLADDPDLKFEDLVTPLFTEPQEPAVNAELLEALKFYANPEVYKPDSTGRVGDLTFVARAAIVKAGGAA